MAKESQRPLAGILGRSGAGRGVTPPGPLTLEGMNLGPTRVRLHFHKRDVRVEVIGAGRAGPGGAPPIQGERRAFTRDIGHRLTLLANNCPAVWMSLLTLTYPETWPKDGRVCREHLRMFIQALQRATGIKEYLWVREFQKRGAPHYHMLTDLDLGFLDKHYATNGKYQDDGPFGNRATHAWVSATWMRVVKDWATPAGLRASCRWEALRSPGGGAGYIAAYAAKPEQKQVPDDFTHSGAWYGKPWGLTIPAAEHVVEVDIGEYTRMTEGKVASKEGWIYGWLHNGRERAHRWIPQTEQLPPPVGEG